MPRRKHTTEQQHTSTVTDDDFDPESQTVRVPSCCDEDEVSELDFHDDRNSSDFSNWD